MSQFPQQRASFSVAQSQQISQLNVYNMSVLMELFLLLTTFPDITFLSASPFGAAVPGKSHSVTQKLGRFLSDILVTLE